MHFGSTWADIGVVERDGGRKGRGRMQKDIGNEGEGERKKTTATNSYVCREYET